MTNDAAKVMVGYCGLTASDRKEVLAAINEFEKDTWRQREILANYQKSAGVSTGPVATGHCPCCGR